MENSTQYSEFFQFHNVDDVDNIMTVTDFLDEVKRVEDLVAFVENESADSDENVVENELRWDPSVVTDYDESKQTKYNSDKDEVVQSFLESLSKFGTYYISFVYYYRLIIALPHIFLGKYEVLLEQVKSPFRSEGESVHRVFVMGSGDKTLDKRFFVNKLLAMWMGTMKKKVPDKKGCPWYAPSSQNVKLRMFLSAVKQRYMWQYDVSDFYGFKGAFVPKLQDLYNTRAENFVSQN